jgi:hypothetical protein
MRSLTRRDFAIAAAGAAGWILSACGDDSAEDAEDETIRDEAAAGERSGPSSGSGGELGEPPERPRAKRPGELPPDGASEVGGIELPGGRRYRSNLDEHREVVAWITGEVPDDPLTLWSRLAVRFPETGLWPLLLEGEDQAAPDLLHDPGWQRAAGRDPEPLLAEWWRGSVSDDAPDVVAPYGRRFPGLAPASRARRRDKAAATAVEALEGIAGLALVAVERPADALGAVGFTGAVNYDFAGGELSAVLRSWEDRFDAILVAIGLDTAVVAVRRPPEGDAALRVAAEQFAFCPDLVWQGSDTLRALGRGVDGATAWSFWWD